jgi:hypothetical protein
LLQYLQNFFRSIVFLYPYNDERAYMLSAATAGPNHNQIVNSLKTPNAKLNPANTSIGWWRLPTMRLIAIINAVMTDIAATNHDSVIDNVNNISIDAVAVWPDGNDWRASIMSKLATDVSTT